MVCLLSPVKINVGGGERVQGGSYNTVAPNVEIRNAQESLQSFSGIWDKPVHHHFHLGGVYLNVAFRDYRPQTLLL